MVPDTAAASNSTEGEVMVSIDGDGGAEKVIIADITREGAWISIPLAEAASIPEWR